MSQYMPLQPFREVPNGSAGFWQKDEYFTFIFFSTKKYRWILGFSPSFLFNNGCFQTVFPFYTQTIQKEP